MREKQSEWPDLEHYANVPLFNTKSVVQQTGIPAPTLRAWERRYAILSPERAQNDYRLYSERDMVLIGWLKERVDAGMSISQAIALLHHLEEERHHTHQKDVPLEEKNAPPLSQMLPNLAVNEKHETRVKGDEPGKDVSYNMRVVQQRLIEAFKSFDEAAASQLMAPMLAVYPIEQVCIELITPTLWEIGRLWEQGLIPVSVEHFASAYFHGRLDNLFHAMPTNDTNPLVIVCCAPGEWHELAPLMLALLLRRAGLHVAYLGQSIETEGLLQTVRQLSPALLCVSVTVVPPLEAAVELGQRMHELPPPRPALIFGGQAFERRTDLIARVPGIYVAGDMQTIITRLRQMAWEHVGVMQ